MRCFSRLFSSIFLIFYFSTPVLADEICEARGVPPNYVYDEVQGECIHFFEAICLYGLRDDQEIQKTVDALLYIANKIAGVRLVNKCKDAAKFLDRQKLLVVRRNEVRNLKPFIGFQNLEILQLTGTLVSDVTELRHLKKLRKLGLESTQISSIESLKLLLNEIPNLQEIDIVNTPIDLNDQLRLWRLGNIRSPHVKITF